MHVAVLMCTFNGARFLREQLDSVAAQTHKDWTLWVSDDGSSDATLDILNETQTKWGAGRLRLIAGPQRGWCANFLSAATHSEISADLFAFCDQDDVWLPEKLSHALAWHSSQSHADHQRARLYCARTALIDAQGRAIGHSPLFTRPPSFANALTQNIGGGNTMVFNQAARALLTHGPSAELLVTHDWWLYLSVGAAGGITYYDARPTVQYRQHGSNLIGSNIGWRARVERFNMLLHGEHKRWSSQHLTALKSLPDLLTIDSKQTLRRFDEARHKPLPQRLIGLWRSGVYRQTLAGRMAFWVGAILGKI